MKFFNTLTGFFNDTEKTVSDGDIIVTAGYSAVNDGGAGTYVLTLVTADESASGIVISGKTFTKGNIQLELISDNGEVYVEQFGASSTASAAVNKAAIKAAVDSGARRVNFRPVQYLVADDIVINHPVDLVGNGAQLILDTDSTSTQLFRVEYAVNNDPAPASISGMKISGTRVITPPADGESTETISYYNTCVKLVNATLFTISNINYENFRYPIYAQKEDSENHNLSNIIIKNCNVFSAVSGITLYNTTAVRIYNCKIDLNNVGSNAIYLRNNNRNLIIEDVSILNCTYGIYVFGNTWEKTIIVSEEESKIIKDATDRYFIKNLLVDGAEKGIYIVKSDIPIHFANIMLVNITGMAIQVAKAENITFTNSSVLMAAPEKCAESAVVLLINGATNIKFTHTQFEFPFNFQLDDCVSMYAGEVNVNLVDCTLQKTDVALENPSGFGRLGCSFGKAHAFTQTFDACEFRNYIKNYNIVNFPVTLAAPNSSDSKLIIKNCRFVNENSCTVPYFKLDDSAKYDNIVVYNCFFENYNYTDPNAPSVYPIFGRVVNGSITPSNTDENGAKIHNIFARCNMRSSEPTRNSGTTINEMKEYL